MSLKDIPEIKLEYTTLSDEVVDTFYVPCLKEADIYKRAVGYFSSSILLQISKGLGAIAKKGGKIKLLVSPRLSKDDYDAISKGYDLREYITNKLNLEFDEDIDFEQKNDRFTLLSYLIFKEILDIKIAVIKNETCDNAMYHEKLGIIVDGDDNVVAFTGSANESNHGFNLNYECIDTYCSWSSDDAYQRCKNKEFRFDLMWDNEIDELVVFPFPEVIKEKLLKYNNYDIDFSGLDDKLKEIHIKKRNKAIKPSLENINLFDYQKDAIKKWKQNNYRGIFDMATGTGKTFTGCGALVQLLNDKKRIVAIICCPYIHLVDQWCEEVKTFNIEPIKCYGGINYKEKLKRQLMKFKNKRTDFVCIIISNSSFQIKDNQDLFMLNLQNTLLMVDEAHNFGSNNLSKILKINYPFRLALSATIDRYGDEQGTKRLYDFFGEKCISYDLGRAIQENKLCPYNYHPIIISLDDDELTNYQELTEKIRKFHIKKEEDDIPEGLKKLLIARARIIAKAKNKLIAFRDIIYKFKRDSNIIIYCGAVKYNQHDFDDCEEDKKQIQIIKEMLTDEFDMISTKFTAEEDSEKRKRIIESFKLEEIQALIAIKCLDEGMNIPAIKTAFILASSTNPKEYIQRRGRVLRKDKGKKYAEIYDFITLPRNLKEVKLTTKVIQDIEVNLVKKELIRLIDFANLANNSSESNKIIDEIKNAYKLNMINEEEVGEYD